MSIFVFLGPSLSVDEARTFLDAIYLPPIALGDLYSVLQHGPTLVAIIDGVFDSTPTIWHKEILFALSQGVPVFGAASMGAIRAAELHTFGMVGVGEIFRAYRDGVLEDDDEVAVAHGPEEVGHRAISDAMVNIRDGLRRAESAGVISAASHQQLLHAAKKQFYPRRFWPNLLRQGTDLGLAEGELAALGDFLKRERPNQKRADAIELLRHIAALRTAGIERHVPSFQFEPTTFWVTLTEREVRARTAETHAAPRQETLRRHVRALAPNRSELLRSTLLMCLVAEEMRRSRHAPEPERIERFLRDLKESTRGEVAVTDDELHSIAEVEAGTEELIVKLARSIDRFLFLELKRRGQYSEFASQAAAKWARLEAAGFINPTFVDAGIDETELLEWYRQRFGITEIDPELHARELGFPVVAEFYRELIGELLVERMGLIPVASS